MAAVPSPQDVYAKHLASGRGYPLWTPEPSVSLPATYRQGGLKIGDVGVVVPENGSFDVFFNITLPPSHILHQETGVPDNFTPIPRTPRDTIEFPEAEGAGRVISTSSVTRTKQTDTAGEDLESRVEPGLLNYQFTLSSREGAVLVLPEGAECCYLRNERPYLEAAMQHAVDWYTFAEQRLGRIISHDSLYLITGFHKARSWSLAAYQQGAGTGETSAQFKAVQIGRGNIPACYTWETTQAMDWRVGPSDLYYNGIPNQSVFINGFKIAIREGILGSKRVAVKADIPSVRPSRAEFFSSSWFSNLWSRVFGSTSGSTSSTSRRTGTNSNTGNSLLDGDQPRDNVHDDITIHCFPQVTKPFHPSDIINQHLLHEMPSATVAVTHDSQWTMLLQNGLLKPGELSQDRFIAEVTSNYIPILTHQGAVYLESRVMDVDVDDDAKLPATEHEGNSRFPLIPHVAHLCDSDILTALGKQKETQEDGVHLTQVLINSAAHRSPAYREYRSQEQDCLNKFRDVVIKKLTKEELQVVSRKAAEILSLELRKHKEVQADRVHRTQGLISCLTDPVHQSDLACLPQKAYQDKEQDCLSKFRDIVIKELTKEELQVVLRKAAEILSLELRKHKEVQADRVHRTQGLISCLTDPVHQSDLACLPQKAYQDKEQDYLNKFRDIVIKELTKEELQVVSRKAAEILSLVLRKHKEAQADRVHRTQGLISCLMDPAQQSDFACLPQKAYRDREQDCLNKFRDVVIKGLTKEELQVVLRKVLSLELRKPGQDSYDTC